MFGGWAITFFFLVPLLFNDPILNRDDLTLINPLRDIKSLNEYLSKVKSGDILDLQPVRDFSFVVNIKLSELFGWNSFHWMNFGLWILLCLSVYQIMVLSGLSSNISTYLVFLFSIHPALLTSVMWISSRKHLLAAVFLLQATNLTLKCKASAENPVSFRNRIVILFFYMLSIFSQPIGILWPVWAFTLDFYQRKKIRINKGWIAFYTALFSFCLFGIISNYRYYTSLAFNKYGGSKFVDSPDSIGVSILSAGRFFIQLLYPFKLAASYYPGVSINLIGICLCIVFFVFSYKKIPKDTFLYWTLFFWFPVLTVTARMTNIFFFDTYLLLPAVGFFVILGNLFQCIKWPNIFHRAKMLFLLLTAGAFLFQTSIWAKAWQSYDALWRHSYYSEPCPTSLNAYGRVLLNKGQFDEAFNVAYRLKEWEPQMPGLNWLFTISLYKASHISASDKIKLLTDSGLNSAWVVYIQSSIHAENGDFVRANELLKQIWNLPDLQDIEPSKLAAEMEFMCTKVGDSYCDNIPGKVRKVSTKLPWLEEQYKKRASDLGLKPKS